MVKVGMGYQHHIDRRQITHAKPRTSQPLQHKEPAREVGIDNDTVSPNLNEEAGVSDKGDPQLAIAGQAWLVGFAAAGSYDGMAHQASKIGGALAKGRIAKRCFDHPGGAPEA